MKKLKFFYKKYDKKNFLLLAIIFVVGLFLRFYHLTSYPVGFQFDEASKGYTAYSLLKTGRDDNGNILPLYVNVFGDNSPSGYHYTTVASVAVFGLTEFAVRFPGALFGALSVLAIYFLCYSIFEDKKMSLLSSLLLAISPWHINLSRASSESIVALFFIISGFSLVIWSLKKKSIKYLSFGALLLFISFFFYQTPRVFVPLLLFPLGFFHLKLWNVKKIDKFKTAFIVVFLLIAFLDFILIFAVNGGTGRFTQVNIFSYPETKLVMEEQIREDGISNIPVLITRFFHNKIVNNFLAYSSNYLQYFSWNFLFVNGLPSIYSVPNMGVLYFLELPLVIIGLFSLVTKKAKMYWVPLLWLILAPVTAALAVDVNNMQRALVMFLILELIAAYGVASLLSSLKKYKKFLVFGLGALFLLNFSYFIHQYLIHSRVHRPWYRDNGTAEMVKTVKKSYDSYDRIVVTRSTGGIYPLIQFFMQYDPKKYQEEGSPKDASNKGFGKFFFVDADCPSYPKFKKIPRAEHTIYIDNGSCQLNNQYKETPIYREDGSIAFRIVYGDKKL